MTENLRDLTAFFAPRSIAVVGAGERATSSGGAVLQNLKIGGFKGQIYPINPKGGQAFGYSVQTSLKDLSAPADLVVIVIRSDLIVSAVREAAATGHKNLLILPGGFIEAGEEGRTRNAELHQIAVENQLTIAGPNCAGIIHMGKGSLNAGGHFGATFLRDFPPGGGIALISQSGALAEEVIAKAQGHGIPIGTVVSVGNAMHLGVAEYLDYLGQQTDIHCILLYAESIEDPTAFRTICRKVAAKKPVILLLGGCTPAGAAAAGLHTGAVANTDEAMSAFAEECCAIRVTSLRHLLLAAKGFGFFPQGLRSRVLILSNSGGPGVLAADRAIEAGLELVPLPAPMAQDLRAGLPAEAAIANPMDLLADAREDRFVFALEQVQTNKTQFDALLGIHVVPFMVDADPVITQLADLAGKLGLPFLHSMMGTLPAKETWFAKMEAAGVPMFNDAEEMVECAALLARYPDLKALAAKPTSSKPLNLHGRRSKAT